MEKERGKEEDSTKEREKGNGRGEVLTQPHKEPKEQLLFCSSQHTLKKTKERQEIGQKRGWTG
jgi:hypothetical protein